MSVRSCNSSTGADEPKLRTCTTSYFIRFWGKQHYFQQILGSGSPTNISIIQVTPKPVCMRTIRAGSSRTSPMVSASSPPQRPAEPLEQHQRLLEPLRQAVSGGLQHLTQPSLEHYPA